MHLEERHKAPASLRDFLKQYAMIVLSILTALALERGAIALQDRSDARASRARIVAELKHNFGELDQANTLNAANQKVIQTGLAALIDKIKKGGETDDTQPVAVVNQLGPHLSISLPSLERDAWEAAIADHSADHLDPHDLRQFTELYADQRDVESTSQLLLGGDWMSQMSTLMLAVQLGHVEPKMLAYQLLRFINTCQQIAASQKQLLSLLREENAQNEPP